MAPRRRESDAYADRRKEQAAATRDSLVATAVKVFNEVGYLGTDSNALARSAGYSPGTFYRHFPDKRAIFVAAYDEWAREEHASLAKVFCTSRARETVGWARELLGGNGILLDHHVARFVADAEAIYSYEGTREINALVVGRAITGFGAFV